MLGQTQDMKKAHRAHLSNEERQIEALEQIADGIRGIYGELQKLNLNTAGAG